MATSNKRILGAFQGKPGEKDLRIKHISTGDILREEIEKNSSVGKKIKKFIEKGELAPIDLNYIIKRIIPKNKYILDGYPRTLEQARFLDNYNPPDFVIVLDVPFHVLKARLLKRAKLEGRSDDTPDTIKERFKVYREQTQPLLKYYKNRAVIIEGDRSVDEIEEEVIDILKKWI